MKKILLATTILVGSTGVAAADIAFSGDAWVGITSSNGGTSWNPKAIASLDIAMSGETDGGLAFGADFTIHAVGASGNAGGGTPTEDETNGPVSIWLSGSWGELTVSNKVNNYDNVKLAYEYTMSAFTVEASYIWDEFDTTNGDWSLKGTYAAGSYEFWLKYAHDASAAANTTSIGGEAEFGMVTVTASIGDVALSSTTWALGLGYASGATSVDLTLKAGSYWKIAGEYDLGGGAAVEAAFDSAGAYSVGIGMEF